MDSSELFKLGGKIAIVTGSAQGLGKEIALSLARNGCFLVLADIVYPEETARQIEEIGSRSVSVRADISDEAEVRDMVEKAILEYKKVDILVNNAGISQLGYTATEDLPIEEWDKIIAINLRGTFLCCKHVGKQMIGSGGGSIINISTTAGVTGVPRAPAYCASKAGIILLTKSLALEWVRYHIRVNAIAPHYLETELTKGLRASEKVYDGLVKQIPMRRFAKPEEIVGTVLLLSSPASSYITGTVIVVDGGYLAQ
jgi:NAD(P)-dependent dehydrogenase (short-subunit alcohol dehydrogenase family)